MANGYRGGFDPKGKKCVKCGKPAAARYRKAWYCGDCLNPNPSKEYLDAERERANGHWGGIDTEQWNKC
jgi:hypothetical protein